MSMTTRTGYAVTYPIPARGEHVTTHHNTLDAARRSRLTHVGYCPCDACVPPVDTPAVYYPPSATDYAIAAGSPVWVGRYSPHAES